MTVEISSNTVKELNAPLGKDLTLAGPFVAKGGEEAFCPCPPLRSRQAAIVSILMLYR